MKFFSLKRTGDPNSHFKGVETESQKRFVSYFQEIVNKHSGKIPDERPLVIEKILLKSIHSRF